MSNLNSDKIIESLRKGIPPEGKIQEFTVGRADEINKLVKILSEGGKNALLLKANYGSGKTHLLKLIRETALKQNYAVSMIEVSTQSGVKFNRMDQIFGQLCRRLETPDYPGQKSVRYLFNSLVEAGSKNNSTDLQREYFHKLTNGSKWDYSNLLASPSMYIALRAWCFASEGKKDYIEDWLFNPDKYYTNRKALYKELIVDLRNFFRDPRSDWQFYKDGIFAFNTQGYFQSWNAINDLDIIAKLCGYRGLILLFDEFEDVIHNLKNKNYQQVAFWNLFQFFSGDKYQNLSFFAVTPDFVKKCKEVLMVKGIYDYDYSRFDDLTSFEMSQLTEMNVLELARKIVSIHFDAYGWSVPDSVVYKNIRTVCREGMSTPIQDRVRQTIKGIVAAIDNIMEVVNG